MEPVGRDLVEFWNWAASRGEMNRNTAAALRSACKEVLSTIEPEAWETLDLREIDLDSFCQRFVRLRTGSNFKPDSLARYQARFKKAVAMYLKYLEAPDRWHFESVKPEPKASSESVSIAARGRSGRSKPSSPPTTAQIAGTNGTIAMITHQYPLRPWRGVLASLSLPMDLTRQEAKRLAAFVDALAVDPQLALPPAPEELEAS